MNNYQTRKRLFEDELFKNTGKKISSSYLGNSPEKSKLPSLSFGNASGKLFSDKPDTLTSAFAQRSEAAKSKQNSESLASYLRKSVKKQLSGKYSSDEIERMFDGIDDDTIERNIPLAEDTAKNNLRRRAFTEFELENNPGYLKLLTMSYAAAEKGKNKEAVKFRREAYENKKESSDYENKKMSSDGSMVTEGERVLTSGRVRENRGRVDSVIPYTPPTIRSNDRTNETLNNGKSDEIDVVEAAMLAKHIYSAPEIKVQNDNAENNVVEGWKYLGKYENDGGLQIGIYSKDINEKTHYILVNSGSTLSIMGIGKLIETRDDWKNNFQQPFGESQDMKDSIEFAKKFVEEHPDSEITFVGHSKGGAEAAANAVATNKNAILFNPATVMLDEYGLDLNNYKADMKAYVVDGEILNSIFKPLSFPLYNYEEIGTEGIMENLFELVMFGAPYAIGETFYKHLMGSVIKELKKKEGKNK